MSNQKVYFCNESNPTLTKMAFVTGNKITSIAKRNNILSCKFNGEIMSCSYARQLLVENYHIVDSSNNRVTQ